VRDADRWVDDGDVITSAGVSAGIDMALHLVARLASPGTGPARSGAASSTTPSPPSDHPDRSAETLMRFIDASTYTAERPWGALDLAEIDDVNVRLHWTDQPYLWQANAGPEVLVVLAGTIDLHYRRDRREHVERLTPGRICYAEAGGERAPRPRSPHPHHRTPGQHLSDPRRQSSPHDTSPPLLAWVFTI